MPSERFVDALNDQIAREFAAAHQYTAIGAYYDRLRFPRLSKFFFDQAEEERGHAMKMVDYLRDTGSDLRLGEGAGATLDFSPHIPPNQIARETNDYASEGFMQWFVDEQVEEESSMGDLLEVAERVRDFPMMLEEF